MELAVVNGGLETKEIEEVEGLETVIYNSVLNKNQRRVNVILISNLNRTHMKMLVKCHAYV